MSCVTELCCRILSFQQEDELIKAYVSLREVFINSEGAWKHLWRVLRSLVILYFGSSVLPRVFLLLHLVSPREVCYSLYNISWYLCGFFLFKCWLLWGKAKQNKQTNKRKGLRRWVDSFEKSKKVSQPCIIANMSSWYKYTFWLICCLNVYLGAVPDWGSSGVFSLLPQVVVQTFARCCICTGCLLSGYPGSSSLFPYVCFHPQVFLSLTECYFP